jgi:hypothetical protein
MRIDLSRQELMICDIIGSIRRKNAMQHNKDRQVSNQDPFQQDIDGFMGEFIVAKYLNLMPDFSINAKKNPIDLRDQSGNSIDVKTTRNPQGKIYVTEYHRNSPCDIYIQVVIDETGGDIIGWIKGSDLFDKATLIGGSHPSYMLEQSDLSSFGETV